MKWFKHFSNAQHDVRIRRLIKKYGLRGYGLYFACVESISYQLETDNPYPEMEESAHDIAEYFGEDTAFIEEVLHYCIYGQELFTLNENTGRLTCLKLLTHLDNTMANNPQIRAIIANFKKLKETTNNLLQTRLGEEQENEPLKVDKELSDDIDNIYKDEQQEKENIIIKSFEIFWDLYDYKKGKDNAYKKWRKLKKKEHDSIIAYLPAYIKSTPDKKFRKHPSTFLNNRAWEDEITTNTKQDFQDKIQSKPKEDYHNGEF